MKWNTFNQAFQIISQLVNQNIQSSSAEDKAFKIKAKYKQSLQKNAQPDEIDTFQIQANAQANTQIYSIKNGVLFSIGSQMLVTRRLDSMTNAELQIITTINLIIVGQKVQQKNTCYYVSTIIFGALLIFPFIMMCCQWWKDIIHPKFVMDFKTYEHIAKFIGKCPLATTLKINVIDNNLTKQKTQVFGLDDLLMLYKRFFPYKLISRIQF